MSRPLVLSETGDTEDHCEGENPMSSCSDTLLRLETQCKSVMPKGKERLPSTFSLYADWKHSYLFIDCVSWNIYMNMFFLFSPARSCAFDELKCE